MTKLAYLKRSAIQSCEFRGHTMTRFSRVARSHVAHCKGCNKQAWVTEMPLPNDIMISGEAVALNCGVPLYPLSNAELRQEESLE